MVNVFRSTRFVLDLVVSIDWIFQEFDSRLRVLFSTTHDDLIQNTPNTCHWVKMSKYRVFPSPYFPAFGLNTEISFGVKYGPEKNYVFGHFSRSV